MCRAAANYNTVFKEAATAATNELVCKFRNAYSEHAAKHADPSRVGQFTERSAEPEDPPSGLLGPRCESGCCYAPMLISLWGTTSAPSEAATWPSEAGSAHL